MERAQVLRSDSYDDLGVISTSQMLPQLQEFSKSDLLPRLGRPHTPESRAKISAANAGKVPWNKGGSHSEETKLKIAEAAKRNAVRRREAKATAVGLTLEELDAKEAEDKAARANRPKPPMPAFVRAKIGAKLKSKWADPDYRRKMSTVPRRHRTDQSPETKKKISESLKKKWAEDPSYREAVMRGAANSNSTEAARAKISATLKAKWKDPEFRDQMTKRRHTGPQTEEHRQKISEAIKVLCAPGTFPLFQAPQLMLWPSDACSRLPVARPSGKTLTTAADALWA